MLCWSLLLMACSERSNVLGLLVKPWVTKDAQAQLSRSEILFDAGDYQGALDAAEAAFALAPEQGRIATQLGYTHLGVAGLDLFHLARRMIEKQAEKKASTGHEANDLPLVAEGSTSTSTAEQMAAMADLVGLTADDYAAITLPGNRLGSLEGAPASGPFTALPVLLPKTAPEARDSESATLGHIAAAVRVLCPFMEAHLKIQGDHRYNDESCAGEGEGEEGSRASVQDGKALFVWAIAHLVEALAFHQVVLYQPEGGTPYLIKRSEALKEISQQGSILAYVTAIQELAAVMDIVMPTAPEAARTSMLGAMFNDLEVVTRTFQSMAGIPPSLSGGIVGSLEQLKGQREKLETRPGQTEGQDKNSVVLKDQLTAGLGKELKEQITKKSEAGELSAAEKSEVCAAYQSISSEALTVCDGL